MGFDKLSPNGCVLGPNGLGMSSNEIQTIEQPHAPTPPLRVGTSSAAKP
jgi:hypothetical protein